MSITSIPNIRLANPEDASRISTLLSDLAIRYISHEFSSEAAARLLASMDEPAIRGYLAAGYRYHLSEVDGELAGVVAVRDNRHLYHLFVSEPFQGKGLAKQLWDVARTASIQAGNSGVFTVNSSLYAVGLYEKLGFVRQSEPAEAFGIISIPMKLDWTYPDGSASD